MLAALCLLGFLVVSLVLLAQMRERYRPAPPPPASLPDSSELRQTVPMEVEPPVPPPGARARAAIIMDDLGRDLSTGHALLELPLEITFAILPSESQAVALAELARSRGREVLVHIPMEPQSYPLIDPGADALFLDQSPGEIRRRVSAFFDRLPQATGGNNHMGSRFTQDAAGMQEVMAVLRERGLFFIDSVTTGATVGYAEARKAGLPAVERDVFLDNVQEVDAISEQIRKLARLAIKQGEAVGICHPHRQTLEALRREASTLKEMGVEVVPVSRLLHR